MKDVLRAVSCTAVLMAMAAPAFAQTVAEPSDLAVPHRLFTVLTSGAAPQTRQRDSLWNGVLVGAALGAMTGVAIGVAQDNGCEGCTGFNTPLTYGVLFGGIGAGIGAGVDAIFQRHAVNTAGQPRERRVRLLPLVSKEFRGIAGWIRF
jgi:hypothetical protein